MTEVAPEAFYLPTATESVVRSRTNGPLLAAAAQLWIKPDDLVVDVTYGKGMFWTRYRPPCLVTHDKYTLDGVDFTALPEEAGSVNVVVFDPPYVSVGGRDTSTRQDYLDRFGLRDAPKNPRELSALIAAGLTEAYRVLAVKGRLLVKTMDYVSSGGMVWGRHHVVVTAVALGFRQVDEFVHVSGTGPQPQGRQQHHSRRAHSFLCVFEKPTRPTVDVAAPMLGGDE